MKYKQWDCEPIVGYYGNGNTAIQLIDKQDKSLVAVATINLIDGLPENQAFIKDYSENEGMLEALKDVGIVTKVIGNRRSGYITAPLCELDLEKLGGR